MGTYTDLLNLKKPSAPPSQPKETPPVTHDMSTPSVTLPIPRATTQATVWENEVKNGERQNDNSPSGDFAESPDRQVAKSPNRRLSKRRVVHRGMDVYLDQLQALDKLRFALWRRDDRKPTMRELILAAIDEFIERQKEELNEK
ncbi:MAG: hypothetical protein KF716_20130 [Anaerolineae bacterium]|nr:hypothetical protein [Anaerolineae bacterium]